MDVENLSDEVLRDMIALQRGWVPAGTGPGEAGLVGMLAGGTEAKSVRAELAASRRRFWSYMKPALACEAFFGVACVIFMFNMEPKPPAWMGYVMMPGLLACLVGMALSVMTILPALNYLSLLRLSRPASPAEMRKLQASFE